MNATLTAQSYDIIKQVDLPRFLCDHNVSLTMRGSRPWAQCWVHNDKTPSVVLTEPTLAPKARWTYYCHGCGNNYGDALDAAKNLKGLQTGEAIAYLEDYLGQHRQAPCAVPARSQVAEGSVMSRSEQATAARIFIEELDRYVPQARDDATAYMQSRGVEPSVFAHVGGGRLIRRLDWFTLNASLRHNKQVEQLCRANFVVEGNKGLRYNWFDDVVLSASRARSGEDLYFWGRRIDPTHFAPTMKYQNQSSRNGVRHVPFGLDAVVEAAAIGGVVRAVEGPITALGSRSLQDGNAAPTFAVLHRLGWGKNSDDHHRKLWAPIIPALQRCKRVEICPDNDACPQKLTQGVELASNCVRMLRNEKVSAYVRLFQPYLGPIERDVFWRPFDYTHKDFADVSKHQLC